MPLSQVSTLSGRSRTYPAGYEFPIPFGGWPSLPGTSLPRRRVRPPLRSAYWQSQTATGLSCSAPVRDERGGCLFYSGVEVSSQGASLTPWHWPIIAVFVNHLFSGELYSRS